MILIVTNLEEARDAARHPTIQGTTHNTEDTHTTKHYLPQNVSIAEIEKLCSNYVLSCMDSAF